MSSLVIGLVIVAVAIAFYAFDLYVSYDTEGGSIGMVPVLVGAVAPPMLAALGSLYLMRGVPGRGLWAIALYVVMVPLAYWGIDAIGQRGRRDHEAQRAGR